MSDAAPLKLSPKSTALVLIDLQKGITGREVGPYKSSDVVQRSAALAARFRKAGGVVVLVHVGWRDDLGDRLSQPVDAPNPPGNLPAGFADLLPELDQQSTDLVIMKRQWGAFYGTDLELQLHRRGVDTIVLAGIATNIGVESTARDAYERNFALILVEDAMAAMDTDAHHASVGKIFPRIGRVRSTEQVLAALHG